MLNLNAQGWLRVFALDHEQLMHRAAARRPIVGAARSSTAVPAATTAPSRALVAAPCC
ncbi:MAG: hypothetical protein ACKVOG_10405 [Rhodoglobus sp.]